MAPMSKAAKNLMFLDNQSMTSTNKNDQDQVFQLQMEVTKLREKLKIMESTSSSTNGSSSSNLMDLIQQKDEELQMKNKQLAVLNDKFYEIKKGLGAIESERTVLKKSKSELEGDRKKLQRHLEIREKEVTTLVNRCAQQEERIQVDKDIRIKNAGLLQEVEELQQEKKEDTKQKKQMEELIKSLKRDVNLLKERIDELKKKSKKDTDALLKLVSSLEKQLNEKDKTMGGWSVNMERALREADEKNKKIDGLEKHIKRQEERISVQRKSIEQNEEEIQTMVREKEDMIKLHEEQMKEQKLELAQQRTDMTLQLKQALEKAENDSTEKINSLESALQEKAEAASSAEEELLEVTAALNIMESEMIEEKQQRLKDTEELVDLMNKDAKKWKSEKEKMEQLINSKEETLSEYKRYQERLENENTTLREEKLALEITTRRTQNESKKATSEMKDEIQKLHKKIIELENENKQLNESKLETVESMRVGMDEAEKSRRQLEEKFQLEMSNLEEEKHRLKDDLEAKLQESEAANVQLRRDLADRDLRNSDLATELEITKAESIDKNDAKEDTIKTLKNDLASSEKALSEKEKELNHVKNVLLKESIEESTSLQNQMKELRSEIETSELNAAGIVAELEQMLDKSEEQRKTVESQLNEANNKHSKNVSSFNEKIDALQTENTIHRREIQALQIKLKSSDENVLSLKNMQAKQEEKFAGQRNELDQLIDAYEKSKEENKLTIARLELEIVQLEEERARHADDEFAFQENMERLSEDVAAAEDKVSEYQATIDKLKENLSERTKLLGHMVSQNKDLERDLSDARGMVSELQEESESRLLEKKAVDNEVKRLRAELESFESIQLMKISNERAKLEASEYELESTKKSLERALQDSRDLTELQKRNRELQDKVKRQEEYLKRKLQKEKILKDRINHTIPTTSTSQIPFKGGKGRSTTTAKKDTRQQTQTLFPDELEEILDDEV